MKYFLIYMASGLKGLKMVDFFEKFNCFRITVSHNCDLYKQIIYSMFFENKIFTREEVTKTSSSSTLLKKLSLSSISLPEGGSRGRREQISIDNDNSIYNNNKCLCQFCTTKYRR
jgi:hypothetical protein